MCESVRECVYEAGTVVKPHGGVMLLRNYNAPRCRGNGGPQTAGGEGAGGGAGRDGVCVVGQGPREMRGTVIVEGNVRRSGRG